MKSCKQVLFFIKNYKQKISPTFFSTEFSSNICHGVLVYTNYGWTLEMFLKISRLIPLPFQPTRNSRPPKHGRNTLLSEVKVASMRLSSNKKMEANTLSTSKFPPPQKKRHIFFWKVQVFFGYTGYTSNLLGGGYLESNVDRYFAIGYGRLNHQG